MGKEYDKFGFLASFVVRQMDECNIYFLLYRGIYYENKISWSLSDKRPVQVEMKKKLEQDKMAAEQARKESELLEDKNTPVYVARWSENLILLCI